MPKRARLFATLFAAMIPLLTLSLASAAEIATDMQDFTATVDKQQNLHMKINAEITAPQDKVFDAIAHPELTSRFDPQVQSVKVVSDTPNARIVEFTGTPIPIPNAPKSIQVKLTPDKANARVKAESVGKLPLTFENTYKLSRAKDGKGTEVEYTSVSSDASKQLGMQIPEGMRKQIAIENFMQQMHTIAAYLQDGGKKVASSHK